jgi:hypothetical protein
MSNARLVVHQLLAARALAWGSDPYERIVRPRYWSLAYNIVVVPHLTTDRTPGGGPTLDCALLSLR